ncbi:MAG: hypothetical protein H7A37_09065 [Chlamydiales bacterium]|nr:hypothetical protein [Chlamydiia bacterium]MCP5508428.1 hypothetical protein [Chlamydiales bacterium]
MTSAIIPTAITQKTWEDVYDLMDDCKVSWEGKTLCVTLQYGGSEKHPFEAKVLDVSEGDRHAYQMILEDLMSGADNGEALIRHVVKVDMQTYSNEDATLTIMTRGWKNTANRIAEITLKNRS